MKLRFYIRDIIWLTLWAASSLAIYLHFETIRKTEEGFRERGATFMLRLSDENETWRRKYDAKEAELGRIKKTLDDVRKVNDDMSRRLYDNERAVLQKRRAEDARKEEESIREEAERVRENAAKEVEHMKRQYLERFLRER
jgi:hypothetical protein